MTARISGTKAITFLAAVILCACAKAPPEQSKNAGPDAAPHVFAAAAGTPVFQMYFNGTSVGYTPNLTPSLGSLTNVIPTGQYADLNSMIWGDISQPDIVAIAGGTLEDLPHVQPNVAVPDSEGFIDASLVNGTAWPGAMTQAILFTANPGISQYAFEVDAARPAGCSAASIVLEITDKTGGVVIEGPETCVLASTTSYQTCTSGTTSALVGNTPYRGQILYNQGGSTGTCGIVTAAEALISRIRVRPVASSIPILTSPFVRYHAQPNQLWNNARDILYTMPANAGVVRELSDKASFVFETNASQIAIQTFNNWGAAPQASIGVLVNDKPFFSVQPIFQVFDLNVVNLPPPPPPPPPSTGPGVNKVEVVSQGGIQQGDWVQSVIAPKTAIFKVTPPPQNGERWLFYGDSKCEGRGASIPVFTGFIGLLRRQLTGTTASECWDGRALFDDETGFPACDTVQDCSYIVARMALYHATKFVVMIGRNDWGGPGLPPTYGNVTNFAAAYGQFLDQSHMAMTGTPIISESTWLEDNLQEAAVNTAGETLSQYRAAVISACTAATRAGWCYPIDGTLVADYNPAPGVMTIDGIHPNNLGNGVISDWEISQLQDIENLNPPFGVVFSALNAPTTMDYSMNATFGASYLTSLTLSAQTVNLPYNPSVPGNWAGAPPTTVAQALNRIAANTTNAHPIP